MLLFDNVFCQWVDSLIKQTDCPTPDAHLSVQWVLGAALSLRSATIALACFVSRGGSCGARQVDLGLSAMNSG